MRIASNRRLRNPLVLDAAMLQAELHLNVSEFENAVADFGLAEKAASDAGLVEAQVDAICGAALALFNLKRTSETRALGFKALELARVSGSETAVASSQIVLAMERMCMGDLDAAEAGAPLRCRCCKTTFARRFRCT